MRPPPDVDVAIAGAGPAGAAAAIACARAGLRVALLDRGELERERPGETLHPGVEAPLRELGVLERVLGAGFARHEGVWVGWGEPPRFVPYGADEAGPWQGFQAWRARFDALLVAQAVELGAVLHERCRALEPVVRDGRVVGVETSHGELRTRHVVDAAGGGHWLARRLALDLDRRSPPLHARFGYATGSCPRRDDAPAMIGTGEGWTWTARVGEGVYAWTRLELQPARPRPAGGPARPRPAGGPAPPRPAGGPAPPLAGPPRELAHLTPRGHARGADVSWRALRRPAGPGYVAAGDAAVVLDPASSHGVLRALLSGLHAARLVLAVRAGGDEARLAASYGDFLTSWFDHDAAALRELYARLPGAPRWVAEPLSRAQAGAGGRGWRGS